MRDHNMFNSWTVDDVRQYEDPTSASAFTCQVRSLGVGCFQPWFSFTMINSFVMKGNDWRITGLCDHFTEVRRLVGGCPSLHRSLYVDRARNCGLPRWRYFSRDISWFHFQSCSEMFQIDSLTNSKDKSTFSGFLKIFYNKHKFSK